MKQYSEMTQAELKKQLTIDWKNIDEVGRSYYDGWVDFYCTIMDQYYQYND